MFTLLPQTLLRKKICQNNRVLEDKHPIRELLFSSQCSNTLATGAVTLTHKHGYCMSYILGVHLNGMY